MYEGIGDKPGEPDPRAQTPVARVPTLAETLARIADTQDKMMSMYKGKELKKFNLPLKGRVGRGKIKKGWVGILFVRTNKNAMFLKAPIEDSIVVVDNTPHYVKPENILLYKNKPFIIVLEWSLSVLSLVEHVNQTNQLNDRAEGWQFATNYLFKTQIKQKIKMSWGIVLIGLLGLAGLGYYAFKSGAFN